MASSPALTRLRALGPVFRSGKAVEAAVSWRDLYRLRDEGELIELSRGLFQLADAAGSDNADFIAVCARAPHGMVCLNSALAYWDLSDEIPAEVHLGVPEGTNRPTLNYPPTRVHVFNAATFDLGRREVRQARGSISESPTLSGASSTHFGCVISWGSRSRTPRSRPTFGDHARSRVESPKSRPRYALVGQCAMHYGFFRDEPARTQHHRGTRVPRPPSACT